MNILKLLLVFFLFCIAPFSFAKNTLVYFEPKPVILTGMIKILTFPGQPNYTSIKNGDAEETGGYLLLNQPIDVTLASHLKSNNISEKNTKIIQLVVMHDQDWRKIKNGNYVRVEGTLFHAMFGHHHTRALLSVKTITILSKSKNLDNKLHITKEDCQFMQYQNLQTPNIEC